jgi:RNA polymerase sigma-B factor
LDVRLSTGERLVVALEGALDFATALRLRIALYDRIDGGCRQVVLNLGEVHTVDPCAAGVLVRIQRHLGHRGGSLRLLEIPAVLRAELATAGAEDGFDGGFDGEDHDDGDDDGEDDGSAGTARPGPFDPARTRDPWAFEVTEVLHTRYHLAADDRRRVTMRTNAIEMCLPYTKRLARRYHGLGEAEADLSQVAALGLVKAVDGYDPSTGTDFGAYALPTVIGELKRHFRDHGWTVRVPRRLQELILDINHAQSRLTQRLGRSPSVADLADYLDADREQIAAAAAAAQAYRPASLFAPAGDGEGLTPLDRLGEPDTALESVDLRESINPLLQQLPRRDKQIIAMRFYGNMTQSQIAAHLGISQMHVSRLLQRIVFRLRTNLLGEC